MPLQLKAKVPNTETLDELEDRVQKLKKYVLNAYRRKVKANKEYQLILHEVPWISCLRK